MPTARGLELPGTIRADAWRPGIGTPEGGRGRVREAEVLSTDGSQGSPPAEDESAGSGQKVAVRADYCARPGPESAAAASGRML